MDIVLEDFDQLLVGDMEEAEKNLRALLPRAEALKDSSIYLQILSQIALAQAVQKKFDAAHQTLDLAEKQLSSNNHLAYVRILLERGRVFLQQDKREAARPFFESSYEMSSKHGFDDHTINAAHMIPFCSGISGRENQVESACYSNRRTFTFTTRPTMAWTIIPVIATYLCSSAI